MRQVAPKLCALAILLAGCTPTATTRAPLSASEPSLSLLASDAEVWAWTVPLRGQTDGREALTSCEVLVDERVLETVVTGRAFRAELPLGPGDHAVTARCHDRAGRLLRAPTVHFRQRLEPTPYAQAAVQFGTGKLTLEGSGSKPNEGTAVALRRFRWARVEPLSTARSELGEGARLELPLPTAAGEVHYELTVEDERGEQGRARVAIVVAADGTIRRLEEASWIDRAVVYGIIPPLYGRPPFVRLLSELDSLHELGVTTLWLSPSFRTTPDDFGYAVTDYFHVREDFGSERELAELVAGAHARGMRVIMDLVINHSSAEHPYFVDAERRGVRSHYYSFYARDREGAATFYFDWENLPNFNYALPEMQQWSLAFSRYWLDPARTGIDGYRVDAAWGVRERQPDFYPAWSRELRRTRPEVLLLAEASARDPYYLSHGFDAAYDWTKELGHHAWEHVFDEPSGIGERLARALEETARSSPRPERTMRFLNNNDTGERFITKHGEPLTRVATAALLTLPGIPCLYTLDEQGAEYLPYEEEQPAAGNIQGLRELHRTLIALRRTTPALHGPGYERLIFPSGDALVFLRRGQAAGEVALVALNFGANRVTGELTLQTADRAPLSRAREALGGKRRALPASGRLELELAPHEVQIWLPGR